MPYLYKLIDNNQIQTIVPLLQLLNPELSPSTIQDRLTEMCNRGYECLGVYDGKELIGICGLWTLTKIYAGRHLEPDNVFILPQYRNQGIGEQMMAWVAEYAMSKGCIAAELNAYVTNKSGHKFWMNQGYEILGFHFRKKLQ